MNVLNPSDIATRLSAFVLLGAVGASKGAPDKTSVSGSGYCHLGSRHLGGAFLYPPHLMKYMFCAFCGKETGQDHKFCASCGRQVPLPGEQENKKIKKGAYSEPGEDGAVVNDNKMNTPKVNNLLPSMQWFKFWTYFLLPLNALNLLTHPGYGVFVSDSFGIFKPLAFSFACFLCILIYGLHARKAWALMLNMIPLILVPINVAYIFATALPDPSFAVFIIALIISVAAFTVPNVLYFKKRYPLFAQSKSTKTVKPESTKNNPVCYTCYRCGAPMPPGISGVCAKCDGIRGG